MSLLRVLVASCALVASAAAQDCENCARGDLSESVSAAVHMKFANADGGHNGQCQDVTKGCEHLACKWVGQFKVWNTGSTAVHVVVTSEGVVITASGGSLVPPNTTELTAVLLPGPSPTTTVEVPCQVTTTIESATLQVVGSQNSVSLQFPCNGCN